MDGYVDTAEGSGGSNNNSKSASTPFTEEVIRLAEIRQALDGLNVMLGAMRTNFDTVTANLQHMARLHQAWNMVLFPNAHLSSKQSDVGLGLAGGLEPYASDPNAATRQDSALFPEKPSNS
jgi:hypothetical protein